MCLLSYAKGILTLKKQVLDAPDWLVLVASVGGIGQDEGRDIRTSQSEHPVTWITRLVLVRPSSSDTK